MPNVSLPDSMKDYAERQVAAGVYSNISEVERAGMRKLMEEDGASAFCLWRCCRGCVRVVAGAKRSFTIAGPTGR